MTTLSPTLAEQLATFLSDPARPGILPAPSALTDAQCAAIRAEAVKPEGLGHGYFITDPEEALNFTTRTQVAQVWLRYRDRLDAHRGKVRRFLPDFRAQAVAAPSDAADLDALAAPARPWVDARLHEEAAVAHAWTRLQADIPAALRLHGARLVDSGAASWESLATLVQQMAEAVVQEQAAPAAVPVSAAA